MSKLIIVTNAATTSTSDRNALTTYLEGKGWSIWHWFQDLWLIDGSAPEPDAFRDELQKAIPGLTQLHIFSSRLAEKNYSGSVPSTSVEWFKQHWGGWEG